MTLKIAICGEGESGKDLAGEMLAEMSTLRYVASTSKFASDIVWNQWGRWQGKYVNHELVEPLWKDSQACWNDRRNFRLEWKEIIRDHNRDDPAKFYRDCLAEQDILCGIRTKEDIIACRAAGLVDLWIWIERKFTPKDPTVTYGPEHCDIVLLNNGGRLHLELKLFALAGTWGVLK
jgi:hypothetical protein